MENNSELQENSNLSHLNDSASALLSDFFPRHEELINSAVASTDTTDQNSVKVEGRVEPTNIPSSDPLNHSLNEGKFSNVPVNVFSSPGFHSAPPRKPQVGSTPFLRPLIEEALSYYMNLTGKNQGAVATELCTSNHNISNFKSDRGINAEIFDRIKAWIYFMIDCKDGLRNVADNPFNGNLVDPKVIEQIISVFESRNNPKRQPPPPTIREPKSGSIRGKGRGSVVDLTTVPASASSKRTSVSTIPDANVSSKRSRVPVDYRSIDNADYSSSSYSSYNLPSSKIDHSQGSVKVVTAEKIPKRVSSSGTRRGGRARNTSRRAESHSSGSMPSSLRIANDDLQTLYSRLETTATNLGLIYNHALNGELMERTNFWGQFSVSSSDNSILRRIPFSTPVILLYNDGSASFLPFAGLCQSNNFPSNITLILVPFCQKNLPVVTPSVPAEKTSPSTYVQGRICFASMSLIDGSSPFMPSLTPFISLEKHLSVPRNSSDPGAFTKYCFVSALTTYLFDRVEGAEVNLGLLETGAYVDPCLPEPVDRIQNTLQAFQARIVSGEGAPVLQRVAASLFSKLKSFQSVGSQGIPLSSGAAVEPPSSTTGRNDLAAAHASSEPPVEIIDLQSQSQSQPLSMKSDGGEASLQEPSVGQSSVVSPAPSVPSTSFPNTPSASQPCLLSVSPLFVKIVTSIAADNTGLDFLLVRTYLLSTRNHPSSLQNPSVSNFLLAQSQLHSHSQSQITDSAGSGNALPLPLPLPLPPPVAATSSSASSTSSIIPRDVVSGAYARSAMLPSAVTPAPPNQREVWQSEGFTAARLLTRYNPFVFQGTPGAAGAASGKPASGSNSSSMSSSTAGSKKSALPSPSVHFPSGEPYPCGPVYAPADNGLNSVVLAPLPDASVRQIPSGPSNPAGKFYSARTYESLSRIIGEPGQLRFGGSSGENDVLRPLKSLSALLRAERVSAAAAVLRPKVSNDDVDSDPEDDFYSSSRDDSNARKLMGLDSMSGVLLFAPSARLSLPSGLNRHSFVPDKDPAYRLLHSAEYYRSRFAPIPSEERNEKEKENDAYLSLTGVAAALDRCARDRQDALYALGDWDIVPPASSRPLTFTSTSLSSSSPNTHPSLSTDSELLPMDVHGFFAPTDESSSAPNRALVPPSLLPFGSPTLGKSKSDSAISKKKRKFPRRVGIAAAAAPTSGASSTSGVASTSTPDVAAPSTLSVASVPAGAAVSKVPHVTHSELEALSARCMPSHVRSFAPFISLTAQLFRANSCSCEPQRRSSLFCTLLPNSCTCSVASNRTENMPLDEEQRAEPASHLGEVLHVRSLYPLQLRTERLRAVGGFGGCLALSAHVRRLLKSKVALQVLPRVRLPSTSVAAVLLSRKLPLSFRAPWRSSSELHILRNGTAQRFSPVAPVYAPAAKWEALLQGDTWPFNGVDPLVAAVARRSTNPTEMCIPDLSPSQVFSSAPVEKMSGIREKDRNLGRRPSHSYESGVSIDDTVGFVSEYLSVLDHESEPFSTPFSTFGPTIVVDPPAVDAFLNPSNGSNLSTLSSNLPPFEISVNANGATLARSNAPLGLYPTQVHSAASALTPLPPMSLRASQLSSRAIANHLSTYAKDVPGDTHSDPLDSNNASSSITNATSASVGSGPARLRVLDAIALEADRVRARLTVKSFLLGRLRTHGSAQRTRLRARFSTTQYGQYIAELLAAHSQAHAAVNSMTGNMAYLNSLSHVGGGSSSHTRSRYGDRLGHRDGDVDEREREREREKDREREREKDKEKDKDGNWRWNALSGPNQGAIGYQLLDIGCAPVRSGGAGAVGSASSAAQIANLTNPLRILLASSAYTLALPGWNDFRFFREFKPFRYGSNAPLASLGLRGATFTFDEIEMHQEAADLAEFVEEERLAHVASVISQRSKERYLALSAAEGATPANPSAPTSAGNVFISSVSGPSGVQEEAVSGAIHASSNGRSTHTPRREKQTGNTPSNLRFTSGSIAQNAQNSAGYVDLTVAGANSELEAVPIVEPPAADMRWELAMLYWHSLQMLGPSGVTKGTSMDPVVLDIVRDVQNPTVNFPAVANGSINRAVAAYGALASGSQALGGAGGGKRGRPTQSPSRGIASWNPNNSTSNDSTAHLPPAVPEPLEDTLELYHSRLGEINLSKNSSISVPASLYLASQASQSQTLLPTFTAAFHTAASVYSSVPSVITSEQFARRAERRKAIWAEKLRTEPFPSNQSVLPNSSIGIVSNGAAAVVNPTNSNFPPTTVSTTEPVEVGRGRGRSDKRKDWIIDLDVSDDDDDEVIQVGKRPRNTDDEPPSRGAGSRRNQIDTPNLEIAQFVNENTLRMRLNRLPILKQNGIPAALLVSPVEDISNII